MSHLSSAGTGAGSGTGVKTPATLAQLATVHTPPMPHSEVPRLKLKTFLQRLSHLLSFCLTEIIETEMLK